MTTCLIIAAIVSCVMDPTAKTTPLQAAAILAQAPGISNRTNWQPFVETTRGPRGFVAPVMPIAADKPIGRGTESDRSRAVRMGIPGGWTPLEWAILHSSR